MTTDHDDEPTPAGPPRHPDDGPDAETDVQRRRRSLGLLLAAGAGVGLLLLVVVLHLTGVVGPTH